MRKPVNNLVAKHSAKFNRPATHIDRKKQSKIDGPAKDLRNLHKDWKNLSKCNPC